MRHRYSTRELKALRFLLDKYGSMSYIIPQDLESEYYALTGVVRAHGCLYMAAWRMEKGYYDSVLSA